MNILVFLSIFLSSFFVYFKNGPENLLKGCCPSVYFFNEISAVELEFKKFLGHSMVLLYFY